GQGATRRRRVAALQKDPRQHGVDGREKQGGRRKTREQAKGNQATEPEEGTRRAGYEAPWEKPQRMQRRATLLDKGHPPHHGRPGAGRAAGRAFRASGPCFLMKLRDQSETSYLNLLACPSAGAVPGPEGVCAGLRAGPPRGGGVPWRWGGLARG